MYIRNCPKCNKELTYKLDKYFLNLLLKSKKIDDLLN